MTLEIALTPEEEARLKAAAREHGVDPAEFARRVLNERLGFSSGDGRQPDEAEATLALFRQWEAEDATDDPEEIARRNREWEELKAQMNETRTKLGMQPLFP